MALGAMLCIHRRLLPPNSPLTLWRLPAEADIGRRTSNPNNRSSKQHQGSRQANQGFGGSAPPPSRSAPPPSPEEQLVEKLRRIEAIHARPGSEGERQAAERARERIQARLKQLEAEEPPIEFRFTLADQWSRHLFVALMRRYGIRPYRYRGQRRTTVMARLSRSFVNDTLWPEFLELQSTLAAYFDALTDRVIEQALVAQQFQPGLGGGGIASRPHLASRQHLGAKTRWNGAHHHLDRWTGADPLAALVEALRHIHQPTIFRMPAVSLLHRTHDFDPKHCVAWVLRQRIAAVERKRLNRWQAICRSGGRDSRDG